MTALSFAIYCSFYLPRPTVMHRLATGTGAASTLKRLKRANAVTTDHQFELDLEDGIPGRDQREGDAARAGGAGAASPRRDRGTSTTDTDDLLVRAARKTHAALPDDRGAAIYAS